MINDEDVELAISKKNLKTLMFALDATLAFSPTSILQNATLVFKRDNR